MSLAGKTVLITGAAGRIGSATARLALVGGADVVLTDIAGQRLFNLARELESVSSADIHSIEADLASEDGIDLLLKKCYELRKPITSAVHSAYPTSVGWGTPFEKLEANHLYRDLAMQLGGAILFSQKVLAYFQDNGGGDLVHISSIQGIRAPKFEHYHNTSMSSPVEYAAIKAGVISITRWLAKYYSNQGIRVNCISPGGILDEQPPIFLDRYRQTCTNIGMLSADHVAATVVYLLSPDSIAINGQNIVVDDGWSL